MALGTVAEFGRESTLTQGIAAINQYSCVVGQIPVL
jgi:hypothetical protein